MAHAVQGGLADGPAGHRGHRDVPVLLRLERLLRSVPLHQREPGQLDHLTGHSLVPYPPRGRVEPGHRGDRAGHRPSDHRLLLRAEGVRTRRHPDWSQRMKIAVVGGGSTYTPELVDGFARLFPDVRELVLIDPARERLGVVGPFAARIFSHYGHAGKVTFTEDLDAGLADTSVVIIQLRVGGQRARISDETFPLECGRIGQETTGAGGLAKALRTVPVVLDVAERAARLAAPGAWIIDFTNPVGILTRALLDAGHRAVGLCNVAIGFQRRFAAMLGVAPESVILDHVGLNHLTWERAVLVNGTDVL